MPSYFASLHSAEAAPAFLDFAITQLGHVVSSTRILIKDFLPEIFRVIRTRWDGQLLAVLSLLEDLARSLLSEIRDVLPEVALRMVKVLHSDTSRDRRVRDRQRRESSSSHRFIALRNESVVFCA